MLGAPASVDWIIGCRDDMVGLHWQPGFVVEFQYGRRGGHMNEGTKTPRPVSRGEAQKVFNKFVQEKTKKGYMPF